MRRHSAIDQGSPAPASTGASGSFSGNASEADKSFGMPRYLSGDVVH